MSEKDQKQTTGQDESGTGEEYANLSSDEKAAFEKIMSQIEASDDSDPTETVNAPPEEDTPSIESSTDAMPADASEDPTAPNELSSDEELSVDEQAALDKIMAEIKSDQEHPEQSQEGTAEAADDAPETESAEEEALSDDQQAALDKIMAEINGDSQDPGQPPKDNDEDGNEASDEVVDDSPETESAGEETLSDDQQAALDKIMAEINGDTQDPDQPPKDNDEDGNEASDEAANDAPETESAGEETLSDDQQAALDKIMAEINGNEQSPEDNDEASEEASDEVIDEAGDDAPETESADEASLSDDQQATLDKIMSEIKGNDSNEPEQPAEKESLSLDEFNEELTNLLTNEASDDSGMQENPPDPGEPALPDDSHAPSQDEVDENISEDVQDISDVPTEANEDGSTEKPKYTLLQEVADPVNDVPPDHSIKKSRSEPGKARARRSWLKPMVAAALVLACAVGAYWGYQRWKPAETTELTALSPVGVEPVGSSLGAGQGKDDFTPAEGDSNNLPLRDDLQSMPILPEAERSELSPLADVIMQLQEAKSRVEAKIQEIRDLIAYYGNGVAEEQDKIEAILSESSVNTLSQALKHDQIHLSMQVIQRRKLHQSKLRIPQSHLETLSEEILYLQRMTRLYGILSEGISNLPIEAFKKEVDSVIQRQSEYSANLSIDHIDVPDPTMASIWEGVLERLKRQGNKKDIQASMTGQNREISKEICGGNYERMVLLTALDKDTAACLSQWHGKDLYLNHVAQLSPESAAALAQWQGEWLSLNGLRNISAEVAHHLALWPGKRLSMNGLRNLSGKATKELSRWNGEQLELIGLKTIGGWKNYATRLYLSEALQRKLQLQ